MMFEDVGIWGVEGPVCGGHDGEGSRVILVRGLMSMPFFHALDVFMS
jgi:hypothetical protein